MNDPCAVDPDCSTKKCAATKLCRLLTAQDTCTNTIVDLLETDVDCGGYDCNGVGKTCADAGISMLDADCTSGQCTGGVCTSCSNCGKDGLESDVDRGGADCNKCMPQQLSPAAAAQKCLLGSDCATGQCEVTAPSANLKYTSCKNGVKNDTETAIDCGGATCKNRCVVGDDCAAGSDCGTGKCTAGTCAALTAVDLCLGERRHRQPGDGRGLRRPAMLHHRCRLRPRPDVHGGR